MRLLIVFLLLSLGVNAQIGTGQWRLHIPAKAIDVVVTDETVWTAYEKGVGEYDKASGEISIWDAVNDLSDISVSCLGYCSSDNSVFIGYENGNLDKIKNNSVTNIPAIKLAQIQGSKTIFKMMEYDEHMYLSTGFAIVKIDPKKNEVRDTYYPTNGNAPIMDLVFKGDSIYALSDDRMYRGYINNPALADPAQWDEDTRVPVYAPATFTDIELLDDEIYLLSREQTLFGFDSLHHVTNSGVITFDPAAGSITAEISSLNSVGDNLCVNYAGGAKVYDASFTEIEFMNLLSNGAFTLPLNVGIEDDGSYWIADRFNGLIHYRGAYNSTQISFSGPPENDFWGMGYANGKMAFTSGGLSLSQPTYNTKGLYTFDDEKWEHHYRGNISEWDNDSIFDLLAVAIHPYKSG